MTFTLLLDLDDTLLNTNLESFVPAYFQAIARHLQPGVDGGKVIHALVAGIDARKRRDRDAELGRDDLRIYRRESP